VRIPTAQELEPVARQHDLKLIVLFGSQLSGRTHPDSDVDIAILPAHRLSLHERGQVWTALCDLFEAEVDLGLLDHAQPLFMSRVADGQALYESEPWAWANFKLYARRLYWDAAPLRAALTRYLDRRAEEMRHAG
jgi:predicted nucleotidyltransferase